MTDAQIPELDPPGLRKFAFVTGAALVVLFGGLLPWALDLSYPTWPWILAGVLALWGLVAPASLRPVYRAWMRFGLLLSRITTPLILGIVFYLIFFPIGLYMKVIRRDTMRRTFNPDATTYRVPSVNSPKEKMERPF